MRARLHICYNIDQHDYFVRLQAARKFLKDGDKVKVIVNLKGRENEFRNIAIELIRRFQNDVGELISEVNSSNRKKQKMLACVGTKSIARIAHEMRSTTSTLENIAEPTEYLRLFAKERKKKDGSWVDKEAEEAYQKLWELHETQLQCNEVDTLTTQEAFTIVLGHRSGYQRGMGEGPLPFKSVNHGGQQNHHSVMNEEITTRIQSEVEEKMTNFCLKKEAELRVTLSAEIEAKLREELRIEMKKELQRLVKEELASSRESHHPPSGSSCSKPIDEKKSVPNDVGPTQCDIELYTCKICNITVNGAQEYMSHMRGERHQKTLNGTIGGSTPTTTLQGKMS